MLSRIRELRLQVTAPRQLKPEESSLVTHKRLRVRGSIARSEQARVAMKLVVGQRREARIGDCHAAVYVSSSPTVSDILVTLWAEKVSDDHRVAIHAC